MMAPWSITLPPGWREDVRRDSHEADAVGRLGRCYRGARLLVYWPRWWMAPFWPLIRIWVRGHERGHAWGVPASGCLAGRRDCLMSEEAEGKDSWWGKAQMWPRQALRLGRPCPTCETYLSKAIKENRRGI